MKLLNYIENTKNFGYMFSAASLISGKRLRHAPMSATPPRLKAGMPYNHSSRPQKCGHGLHLPGDTIQGAPAACRAVPRQCSQGGKGGREGKECGKGGKEDAAAGGADGAGAEAEPKPSVDRA